jgi:ubiquinone/menaquinone biosynthesis C-methylase UbiE
MNKRALLGIYDSYAKNYSELIEKAGWWAPRVVSSFLKPYLKPGDKILDAGCGDGYASLNITDECEVYGFDLSEKMIEAARKRNMKEVILHDADNNFPYKSNSFDAAIALGFFEFIANVHFTLSELKRVVKPSGYILVTVEDFDALLEKQKTKLELVVAGVKKTRYSRKEMTRFIEQVGDLELIKDERIYGYYSESLGGKYYYHYYLLKKLS